MGKLDDPFLRKRVIQYAKHHGNFYGIENDINISTRTLKRALIPSDKYYHEDFAREYNEARQDAWESHEQEQAQDQSGVELFNFEGNQVRHIMRDNEEDEPEPWFLARDICKVLDLNDVSQAVSSIDEDEKVLSDFDDLISIKHVSGQQNRQQWFLNEDGVYELVMRSINPKRKSFASG